MCDGKGACVSSRLSARCLPNRPAFAVGRLAGYTHVVALGSNDIKNAGRAQQRWKGGIEAGLPNYNLAEPASFTDPVDFSNVFTVEDGKPATEDFGPLVKVKRSPN